MAISINPFRGLIETNAYPHARAYRTTLTQKLSDTFFIFFGYFNAADKTSSHAGLFDYLLIGLIPLLDRAREYFTQQRGENSLIARATGGLLAGLHTLLFIPRIIFTVVFYIISFLPVCFIHLGMSRHGKQLKETINTFKSNLDGDELDEETPLLSNTVSAMLARNHTHLENICQLKSTTPTDQPHIRNIRFFAPITPTTPKEVLQLRVNTVTQSSFFQALKELNLGGIQSSQESEEHANHAKVCSDA